MDTSKQARTTVRQDIYSHCNSHPKCPLENLSHSIIMYRNIPRISSILRDRIAGHTWRSKEEVVSEVLLWTSSQETTATSIPCK